MVAVRYTAGVKVAMRVWREGGERERERERDVRERIKKDRERERCQSVSAGVVRWQRLVKVGSPDDYGYGADRV